ncbi:MAG: hypothetical protein J3K34DRAFT_446119 [Monoraphidium minutum]|nr:MAG: hypothetical protein J3K34DRAFT_446119 [Monoraphidium minutum]
MDASSRSSTVARRCVAPRGAIFCCALGAARGRSRRRCASCLARLGGPRRGRARCSMAGIERSGGSCCSPSSSSSDAHCTTAPPSPPCWRRRRRNREPLSSWKAFQPITAAMTKVPNETRLTGPARLAARPARPRSRRPVLGSARRPLSFWKTGTAALARGSVNSTPSGPRTAVGGRSIDTVELFTCPRRAREAASWRVMARLILVCVAIFFALQWMPETTTEITRAVIRP